MRCQAPTDDGDQCQNEARGDSAYCGKHRYNADPPHDAEPPQCRAETQDGDRCQNRALEYSNYCGKHQ